MNTHKQQIRDHAVRFLKNKWSHLPNSKHIDRILDHMKDNPGSAAGLQLVLGYDAWAVAWDKASRDGRGSEWAAIWDAAAHSPVTASDPWHVAWDAIAALIAWDHAGDLVDVPAQQVRVLAFLGNDAAILLYPTILAMEATKELG